MVTSLFPFIPDFCVSLHTNLIVVHGDSSILSHLLLVTLEALLSCRRVKQYVTESVFRNQSV